MGLGTESGRAAWGRHDHDSTVAGCNRERRNGVEDPDTAAVAGRRHLLDSAERHRHLRRLEAVLHYTTNGSNPTEADPVVASGGSVAVAQSLTLKVRAWKPGAVSSEVAAATYELKTVAPALSPGTGQYGSAQSVSMATTTPGATLTYTVDGTEPLPGSTTYSSPVNIADTRTVKVRAFKAGWTPSDSVAASYWISAGTVATPTIAPATGTLTAASLVTMTCATTGATLRYTVDGSDPSPTSPQYRYPILVARNTTVKARAFLIGYAASAVASATYTLDPVGQAARPSISPSGGRFATTQTITITGPAGATLRYTTNGVDPTDTDTTIASGNTLVVDRAQIVKVRAWDTWLTPSGVQRADFLITGAVAAGHQHSLALSADGTVWTWGRGSEGQVGDGTWLSREAPTSMLTNGTSIAGGQYFSLAARADGSVWGWGQNNDGQLGDGTATTRPAPVQVSGLTDVVAVAAGWHHSLALKSDGTVWAWGDNAFGQLGDGTTVDRHTPVQVLGLSGVTGISAGEGHSIAVQRNGAAGGFVWAWGRNENGQLGDGSTLSRPVPVKAIGITDASAVAAGREFAAVLSATGGVRAWGRNETAQVGNLTGASSPVAASLAVLAGASWIASGSNHDDPDCPVNR